MLSDTFKYATVGTNIFNPLHATSGSKWRNAVGHAAGMANDVKVLKLITGEEVIARVTEEKNVDTKGCIIFFNAFNYTFINVYLKVESDAPC